MFSVLFCKFNFYFLISFVEGGYKGGGQTWKNWEIVGIVFFKAQITYGVAPIAAYLYLLTI